MKFLHEKKNVTQSDAWGRDQKVNHRYYEIEDADVRTSKAHYLGHNQKNYTFTSKDVGRHIDVMSDGAGWTCWSFVN